METIDIAVLGAGAAGLAADEIAGRALRALVTHLGIPRRRLGFCHEPVLP